MPTIAEQLEQERAYSRMLETVIELKVAERIADAHEAGYQKGLLDGQMTAYANQQQTAAKIERAYEVQRIMDEISRNVAVQAAMTQVIQHVYPASILGTHDDLIMPEKLRS